MIAPLPRPRDAPHAAADAAATTYIRRLMPSDERVLLAFLRLRPADNAYLLGHVARGALDDDALSGALLGWWRGEELFGVALIGSNLVLSHGAPRDGVEAFARFTRTCAWPVKVIVGPDEVVAMFADALALTPEQVQLVRPDQVLLQVDKQTLRSDARSVELRPAQSNELELMMALDLEMVKEELGIDPFSADLPGFQRGWRRRILEWRAWVAGPLGGPIQCKVDQAAVSDDVVQLSGVYTTPAHRRRGLARRVIGELCHLLLREVPRVALYVHADNVAALRLYRSLGFYEVGRVRSIWL